MRTVAWLLVKLALAGSILLLFYAVYLDGVVSERFEQNRYQAPALLYSRALNLTPGSLTRQRVEAELRALEYTSSPGARDQGEYNARDNAILLHRRAFDFADGFEPSQRLLLQFEGSRLTDVLAWPSQQPLEQARLEPQLIGRFAADSGEDRLLVSLEEVPQLMQDTLLLVEDQDFYSHLGVKPTAIIRAAMANLAAGRTVQGGSTLTQQLVKNMYLSRAQNLSRKFKEALMALSLDYRFSKDEILEAYFNEVYFGQDRGHAIHGVGLASQYFFGKAVEDLSAAEIALLVGMVKGPSLYDPRRQPENAIKRREVVLRLMYEKQLISQVHYLAALDAPLLRRESSRLVLGDRPDYVDLVQRELRQLVPGREWQQTGLRVFTHLDPYLQAQAEQALQRRGGRVDVAELEGAIVVSDHQQGVIRALAGTAGDTTGGFNRALDAKRPIGSLIKPFTYTLALEDPASYRLETLIDDSPLTLIDERDREWTPRNFDGEFKGPVTLYQSYIESRNVPAIRVGMDIGVGQVRERLYNAGFATGTHAYPSLLLGAVDMSPVEVSQIYSVLANRGEQQRLTSIEAVSTHWGQQLYRQQRRAQRVFTETSAYLNTFALQGVVQEGTARALTTMVGETGLAGKTGSTNELRDSWFVSFDDRLLTTVWLGRDDNQPIGLTGSNGALLVAADLWNQTGVEPLQRTLPATLSTGAFDRLSGLPVGLECGGALRLPSHQYREPANGRCAGNEDDEEDDDEPNWLQRLFGG
ncbi:penicillin-binding protein 1B [Aliidiomarina sedimenti]|uniref:Penicillin-binding protein 1B n=1 Tax=Aliidiomarina sedimenti TaxID=1933879 RepID=A0ABY0BUX3_9GAMM|nr:penicillin-binding protein 1B [Aliidiomarina sedimenti]RUO27953.1 penicillin-binding protein 1B [Aliidiomarina sedimenti]